MPYDKDRLIAFETKVASLFNEGKIRAPVHLYDGNEESMLALFKNIGQEDWVYCSWRSHYQCLLKGVPEERVLEDVIAGKSISLCYPDHRIYSSAIVGGQLPIAVGCALDIKLRDGAEKVWCFSGDMTAETGMFYECWKFAVGHDLPITFIVENNFKSVCTDTFEAWRTTESFFKKESRKIIYYEYTSRYPHAGAGVRVNF
jgi:TPP-dependent pyruvate/acetoin dehydrogenase alpha subunit